jgi:hypothetical protein
MSNTFAKVETTYVPITPIYRADDGTHWLQISIPNGWDDVRKVCKRVLSYEGRTYVFASWNSDTMLCHFKASPHVAKFI